MEIKFDVCRELEKECTYALDGQYRGEGVGAYFGKTYLFANIRAYMWEAYKLGLALAWDFKELEFWQYTLVSSWGSNKANS